jgi:hypothetical protein
MGDRFVFIMTGGFLDCLLSRFILLRFWAVNATVDMLKSHYGAWNEDLVRQSFSTEEANMILSIPLAGVQLDDSLFWHFDKYGHYSAKSGYWIANSHTSNPCSSGLNPSVSWWKFFWNLNLPSKVKVFMWKACNGWIPTKVCMIDRGMSVDPLCPVCGIKDESIMHAMCAQFFRFKDHG